MADYVLNMGGQLVSPSSSDYSAVVDVFKATVDGVEHIPDHGLSLSVARARIATASCGEYILAMGGEVLPDTLNTIDVFRVSANGAEQVTDHGLTLSVARRTAAAAAGNYVLAMGGYDGAQFYDTIDVFKVAENGVEAVPDHGLSLSVGRVTYGVGCGDYILALGGNAGQPAPYTDAVDVFKVTANGIEHITDHGLSLSEPRRQLAVAACGEYVLAMGGNGNGSRSTAVDVFKVTPNGVEYITDHGLSLSEPRQDLSSASAGNYIFAVGGKDNTYTDAVDVFKVTTNGVEHITDHGLTLSEPRSHLAAAHCGNYILAMGGRSETGYSAVVDVFQINNKETM